MKALITLVLVFAATTAHANLSTAKFLAISLSPLISSAEFSLSITGNLAYAKEDAANFIASEGAVRTARLQSILTEIRATYPALDASDLELAQEILAL
jgi:conserverd hypothetical protein